MPDWLLDAAERVATTCAAVAVAVLVAALAGWPGWAVIPAAAVVAAVVTGTASLVGDPDTGGFHDPAADDDLPVTGL
jgi:hypothetical protein